MGLLLRGERRKGKRRKGERGREREKGKRREWEWRERKRGENDLTQPSSQIPGYATGTRKRRLWRPACYAG